MTTGQLDFASVIDIGFVLLVTFACLRSLRSDEGGVQTPAWREELAEVQHALKGLIAEAGAASSQLDRNLLKRKEELEALAKRLDESESRLGARPSVKASSIKPEPAPAKPAPTKNDMPNASWTFGDLGADDNGLLGAVDSLADTITLSNPLPPRAAEPKPTTPPKFAPSAPRTITDDIELLKSDEKERAIYERLSIIDPVAYRIARRLLAGGKEIHVVARKLGIPISEVRLLDRLIRQDEGLPEAPPNETIGQGSTMEQRFQPLAPAEPAARAGGELSIERELALL